MKALLVPWYHGRAHSHQCGRGWGLAWACWMRFFAMIPKVDGDATPRGQRPLSVFPVVYRIGLCSYVAFRRMVSVLGPRVCVLCGEW